MNITQITVSYGATQSLQKYCNVKPHITLTAELAEGESVDFARAVLLTEARGFVEEMIDQALEGDDSPARYSAEPRYQILHTGSVYDRASRNRIQPPDPLLVILPNETKLNSRWLSHFYGASRKLRLAHAFAVATAKAGEEEIKYRIIDCADGDLSRLPAWVLEPEEVAD